MAEYSNTSVYVLLKSGSLLPAGVKLPTPGEGTNKGVLPDGRGWFKNCFMTAQEMRDIVHAEDAGKLEIKSGEQMRTIAQSLEKIKIIES